jgi:TRAP-type mannitol/chloroaromatic compound transport system permease large subunit
MFALVTVLVFLLGWPFEWPAVILVFLPIFYPVVNGLGVDLVWFGALVAVTLQTAWRFRSSPSRLSSSFQSSPPGCRTTFSTAARLS